MRFMVEASKIPITVTFEPSGAEYVVESGDHLIIEWPNGPGGLLGSVEHSPDGLVIGEPGNGLSRIWRSSGEELSILG
ncbi:hypothetical protein JT723_34430 [Streptomyces bryophytorum]|nr:hypothetical protein [Actinacidiphila bryophytorum]MBM9440928.1 hypothetical protein [Actinacidiphila bryophytorum]